MEWTGLDKAFLVCAVAGGAIFVIRLALQFMGIDGDADVDLDVDGIDGVDSHGSSFGIFTLHGITSFFMIFGLVGMACTRGATLSEVPAVTIAFVCGVAVMFVIAKMFFAMQSFESSGNIDLANAIGVEGTVYLRIPVDGTGQVLVTVQGRSRIFDARSENNQLVNSGERIVVTEVIQGNVLSIKQL